MMKNTKFKDERVIQLNNKIQSEAYIMVLLLMTVSIFIKSYVMDMSFFQYVVELGIVILSTVYITIRSMFVGYDFMTDFKGGKVSTVCTVLILSLIISITNGIGNYNLYGDKYPGIFDGLFISVLVVTFISATIFLSFIFGLLYFLNIKGQQRIERKISEEDK